MRLRIVEENATALCAGGVGSIRRDAPQEVVEIEEGRKSISGGRRSAEVP